MMLVAPMAGMPRTSSCPPRALSFTYCSRDAKRAIRDAVEPGIPTNAARQFAFSFWMSNLPPVCSSVAFPSIQILRRGNWDRTIAFSPQGLKDRYPVSPAESVPECSHARSSLTLQASCEAPNMTSAWRWRFSRQPKSRINMRPWQGHEAIELSTARVTLGGYPSHAHSLLPTL